MNILLNLTLQYANTAAAARTFRLLNTINPNGNSFGFVDPRTGSSSRLFIVPTASPQRQRLSFTIGGTPIGGTYSLTYKGNTTPLIPFSQTFANGNYTTFVAFLDALNALPSGAEFFGVTPSSGFNHADVSWVDSINYDGGITVATSNLTASSGSPVVTPQVVTLPAVTTTVVSNTIYNVSPGQVLYFSSYLGGQAFSNTGTLNNILRDRWFRFTVPANATEGQTFTGTVSCDIDGTKVSLTYGNGIEGVPGYTESGGEVVTLSPASLTALTSSLVTGVLTSFPAIPNSDIIATSVSASVKGDIFDQASQNAKLTITGAGEVLSQVNSFAEGESPADYSGAIATDVAAAVIASEEFQKVSAAVGAFGGTRADNGTSVVETLNRPDGGTLVRTGTVSTLTTTT